MRIDTPEFKQANEASTKEPRFVVRILFDVDSIAVTSNEDIEDVAGTVIAGALIEPNLVSQLIKPDEATSEIGSASFELSDVSGIFTSEVNERLLDGKGLRRKRVEFYLGYKGLPFELYRLSGTQEIADVIHDNGRYSISCLDIQRALRNDILQPKETTIRESITATQTTIPLTNADAFELVYHGTSYSDAPSTSVGYIKIKKEIIRYTGKSSDDLTGCTRGVFGTTSEAYTVDGGTPADQRERVLEYIYLELPSLKLAYALLTGVLYNDGETLPDHWHLGIDEDLVVESNFIDKPDLWIPADDTKGLILRFLDPGKQDGKRFLEKEVYLASGVFSPVDVQGRLGIRRMNRLIGSAATVMTINADNAVNASQLQHEMDSIHNSFSVAWSFDGDIFRRETRFIDPDSFVVHGAAPVFELKFKGLYSGRHTDAVIFGILDMVRERYAGPPVTMSVDLLHSANRIEIGDVVQVTFPHLKDFNNSVTGTLDRPMEVQRVRCNHRTGRLQVDLFGSTAAPNTSSPTNTGGGFALADSFYSAAGTELSAATGITIASDILTAASSPLTGASDVRSSPAIYYHTGDLTIAAGVVLEIESNVQLRIRGFLTVNGEIRGIGTGLSGVADDGRPQTPDSGPNTPQPLIPGNPGYVGNSHGGAGFGAFKIAGPLTGSNPQIIQILKPASKDIAANSSAPNLLLSTASAGTVLNGLPVDLRGTGGGPGGRVGGSTTNPYPSDLRGGSGANGGAGLLIICRGAGAGANGKIELSGNSTSATSEVDAPVSPTGTVRAFAGSGGAGGPGTLYLLLDGSNISLPDFGGKFVAKTGTVPDPGGNVIPRDQQMTFTPLVEPVGAFDFNDPPISNLDLSGACLRIQYVPGTEIASGDSDSKPPAPTGLSVTGVELGNEVRVTIDTFDQVDTIEVFASLDNDRANAGIVGQGRQDVFRHQLPGSQTRYYWVRSRGLPNAQGRRIASDFFPLSATAGISATSLDGGSGADGQSVEIQYSSDGLSFHDTYVASDIFLRQRIGPGGTYTPAIQFVGDDGAAGATGATGNYIDFIFKRSATIPATPTGNNPSGWSQTPPASDGNPLFVSRGERQSGTNTLIGAWSDPQLLVEDGQDGLPGAQGPGLFTWVTQGSVLVTTGNSITKTGGTAGFNTGGYSLQSYATGCFVSATVPLTDKGVLFGLETQPVASTGNIRYMWSAATNGQARPFFTSTPGGSSTGLGVQEAYNSADVFVITNDNSVIRWLKNGAEKASMPIVAPGENLFLDVSLNLVGASLANVAFGPQGPIGATGAPAKVLRLSASAQAFTFTSAGAPNPSVQTITFTAQRTNIASAVAFSTTPIGITLSGTGDTRTLSVTDFGGNNQVKVTATAEGFIDEITIFRLTGGAPGAAGQSAITGFLTNESHTLAADPGGVVTNFSGATGLFNVFEGVADVTSSATFSVVSMSDPASTVQINTATNTPVAGQPKGFYRVTAQATDSATYTLRAVYSGVTIDKVFSVVKSRQGQPGDGSNLLRPSVWKVDTLGNQGLSQSPPNGGYFAAASPSESVIRLAGSLSGVPLGPFGNSEPLWQCVPSGAGNPFPGWNCPTTTDHTKSYRFFVWVWFDKLSGQVHLGCSNSNTRDLITGAVNGNPYFTIGFLASSGLQTKKWYAFVGVVHGSSYAGSGLGIAGIYEKESGLKVQDGSEFKNAVGGLDQDHRCYHVSDSDSTNRVYFCRPRIDEINGNEPNLLQLLGLQELGPFIARNGCRVSGTSFIKERGTSGWNADVQSIQGYDSAHVQWKAGKTTGDVMIGLNSDPLTDANFSSLDFAWYAANGASAQIYEGGSFIAGFGAYTTGTEFAITKSGSTIRYFKDKVQVRSTTTAATRMYLDSSFFNVGDIATNVRFGPGDTLEGIDSGDMTVGTINAFQTISNLGSGLVSAGQRTMITITLGERSRDYMINIRGQAEFDAPGKMQLLQTVPGPSTSLKVVNVGGAFGGNTLGMIDHSLSIPANTAVTILFRADFSDAVTFPGSSTTSVSAPAWRLPSVIIERQFA